MVQARDAVERAVKLRHQFTLTHAHHHVAWLAYLCGLGQTAKDAAEASIRIAEEQGFAFWIAESTMVRGAALILEGEVERGIDDVRRGGVYTHAAGATLLDTHYAMFLGDGLLRIGRLDEAMATVDTGLAHANASAVRVLEPELLRLRGEILLAQSADNRDSANECFVRSLGIAEKQESHAARLRAAISLYRLSRGTRNVGEARARLAGVFGEYTEGFGLPGLVEARKLLDE
jgi:predicted ATPase